ncbi:MAG: histidinol-phosphatase HisJ family protein [Ardenticatenaceae bacterium]|nr:histidinol-phosphatase HisJ family protein [Ardenticatenaceae bacterium]
MKITNTDYHVHTTFSPDGHDTPEAMCQHAVELGLTGIAFTEHTEWHPAFAYSGFPQPQAYFQRVRQCQHDFTPYGLTVLTGAEIGNPHEYAAQTADLLATYNFDIKIASLHWLHGLNIHHPSCFTGRDPQAVYADYFMELRKLTAVPHITFIAHFDRILWRGMLMDLPLDLQRLQPILKDTLAAIAQSGIGLELNSYHLGSQHHWHEALIAMLSWYREAGGHHILVNSDAHRTQHLTANWHIAADILALAGYELEEEASLALV